MSSEAEANVRQTLDTWLVQWMVAEFGLEPHEVEPTRTFLAYGMDSVQAMLLIGDLEARFGLRLRPTLVWDHPNLSSLTQHLLGCLNTNPSHGPPAAAPVAQRVDPQISDAASAAAASEPQALLDQLDNLSEVELDALLAKYLQQPR